MKSSGTGVASEAINNQTEPCTTAIGHIPRTSMQISKA